MEYWAKRQLEMQKAIENKTVKDTEKQIHKYYKRAMNKVLDDFEATYDKLIAAATEGRTPTPADLYKLDRYWKMQKHLKEELQKLGDKEVAFLSRQFELEWQYIYNSVSIPSEIAFSTVSNANANMMINTVWLADGKTFSQRVWDNVNKLTQTLNDNLIHCVVTGKKTTELRKLLVERFDVSRHQANTLIRTEVAHIKTEAAKQRYMDYGITRYEYLADPDERTCEGHSKSCEALDGKIFKYSEMQAGVNAPPMHPNCRCAIVPVIE